MSTFARHELRLVYRAAMRHPVSTVCIVAVLSLSIAVNLVLSEAIRQLLFLPPPGIAQPEELHRVSRAEYVNGMGWMRMTSTSYPAYEVMRDSRLFDGVAAYTEVTLGSTDAERNNELRALLVSDDYFRTLGVRPHAGRFWTAEQTSEPVVVVTDRYWRGRGARGAVGTRVQLAGRWHTVIGVTPPEFHGVGPRMADVFLPIASRSDLVGSPAWRTDWASSYLQVVARTSGPVEQVGDRLTALVRQSAASRATGARPRMLLQPILDRPKESTLQRVGMLLQALTVLLFLASCAGAASLLTGRLAHRRRELAIQSALGASRSVFVRTAIAEALLFMLVSTMTALFVTIVVAGSLQAWLLPTFAWRESVITPSLALIAGATCGIGSAFVVGCELLALRGVSLLSVLQSQQSSRSRAGRWNAPLVAIQGAVACLLISGAGVFGITLRNLRNADLGFDAERLLVIELDKANPATRSATGIARLETLAEELRGVAGIASVARATSIPLDRSSATWVRTATGANIDPLGTGGPYYIGVDAEYFDAMGITVLRGRHFTPADIRSGARVTVVNETMERHGWGREGAIGNCMFVAADPVCYEIIGVVEDTKRSHLRETATLQFFVPLPRAIPSSMSTPALIVRTRERTSKHLEQLRAFLQARVSAFGRPSVQPLEQLVGSQVREWRLTSIVLNGYSTLAIVVTVLSLTGAVALGAEQRRMEFGVRRALGAKSGHLVAILIRGFALALAIGAGAASVTTVILWERISLLLFRVTGADLWMIAATTAVGLVGALGVATAIGFATTRGAPSSFLRS